MIKDVKLLCTKGTESEADVLYWNQGNQERIRILNGECQALFSHFASGYSNQVTALKGGG